MLSDYKMQLPLQTPESVADEGRAVLEKAQAQVGFIPNVYKGMVNSPALLETYLYGYAAFRERSVFSPQEQEVVFITVSRENGCEYCVSAHGVIADKMTMVPPAVTDAIRNGGAVPDPKLAALSEFTRVMVATRGLPTRSDVEKFLAAGYREHHILDIILAMSVKTIGNFSNHLFHTPLDDMFAGRKWHSATQQAA